MTKSKTHFPQVPVEIAKKVAEREAPVDLTPPPEGTKEGSKGHARTEDDCDELLEIKKR